MIFNLMSMKYDNVTNLFILDYKFSSCKSSIRLILSKIAIFFFSKNFLLLLWFEIQLWVYFIQCQIISTGIEPPHFKAETQNAGKDNNEQNISFNLIVEKNKSQCNSNHKNLNDEKSEIRFGEYIHVAVQ